MLERKRNGFKVRQRHGSYNPDRVLLRRMNKFVRHVDLPLTWGRVKPVTDVVGFASFLPPNGDVEAWLKGFGGGKQQPR